MGFPLVPKSVTLNDLEHRNGRYFELWQHMIYSVIRRDYGEQGR